MNRLAASALGWGQTDDPVMLGNLARAGVRGIEVAPSKQAGPDWPALPWGYWREFRDRLGEAGLQVAAVQSLLYGVPGTLFGPAPERQRIADRLLICRDLAAELGGVPLVFGSMASRRRGDLSPEAAMAQAAEFFTPLADAGCPLLFEAIPAAYGCDFLTRTHDAAELAAATGLGLHLDAGTCTVAGEDGPAIARAYGRIARHVQISGPGLGPLTGTDVAGFIAGLQAAGYGGWISVEMLADPAPANEQDPWDRLAPALAEVAALLV